MSVYKCWCLYLFVFFFFFVDIILSIPSVYYCAKEK